MSNSTIEAEITLTHQVDVYDAVHYQIVRRLDPSNHEVNEVENELMSWKGGELTNRETSDDMTPTCRSKALTGP